MPRNWNSSLLEQMEMLRRRELAVTIGGHFLIDNLVVGNGTTGRLGKLGVAPIPGPSFLGGTALVLFNHCQAPEKALEFIRFLVSPEVQVEFTPLIGCLPTRHECWKMPPYSNHQMFQTFYQAFSQGRGLPAVPLWGKIEGELLRVFSMIWQELFTAENPDTALVVRRHLGALARRLSLSLGS
jgi:ABC-type glycerol-3-phosphate transport system substrate-binding protein